MKKRVLFFVALLCVLTLVSHEAQAFRWTRSQIKSVVDGDSLILAGGESVRLIGVDTPEYDDPDRNAYNAGTLGVNPRQYAEYAAKSEDYAKMLLQNKQIQIEYDVVNQEEGHKDKYDRLLLYIWIPMSAIPSSEREYIVGQLSWSGQGESRMVRDGYVLLNAILIAKGLGYAYTQFPFKYHREFVDLQQMAQGEQLGFWQ